MRRLGLHVVLMSLGLANARADMIIEDFGNGHLGNYAAVPASRGMQLIASVASTYAREGQSGLGLDGVNWYVRDDATVRLIQGESFFAWVREPTSDGESARAYFGFGSSLAGTYAAVLAPTTGQFIIQKDIPLPNTRFTDLVAAPQTYVKDKWYKVAVDWRVGGRITATLYDSDGVTPLNAISTRDDTITSGGIAFRAASFGEGAASFDTVTRVMTAPEPASLVLLGLGLSGVAGLALMARVRRNGVGRIC